MDGAEEDRPGPQIGIAIHTLLASGYSVSGSHTQPRHVEIRCERFNAIGARVAILLATTQQEFISHDEVEDLRRAAHRVSWLGMRS